MSRSNLLLPLLSLIVLIFLTNSCTDINCQTCVNPDICDVCKTSFYLNISCIKCTNIIANCSACLFNSDTGTVTCNACIFPFILNITNNTCTRCSNAIANCSNCTGTDISAVTCNKCSGGFALNVTGNVCVTCSTISKCKTCVTILDDSQILCTSCSSSTVLVNAACIACSIVFPNCNVCNDTNFPLGCVNCFKGLYSSQDQSKCSTCSELISNCDQCAFQAPFQRAQCSQCADGMDLSEDMYSCNQSNTKKIIIGVSVGGGVLVIAVVGFFVYRRWKKNKYASQNPLLTQEQQEKENYKEDQKGT